MPSLFDTAKSVDFKDYAELCLQINFEWIDGAYKCLCPFHSDSHPSFVLTNPNSRKYRTILGSCFVCDKENQGLNIVDFTAKFLRISPYEAAKKICDDLRLNYDSSQTQNESFPDLNQDKGENMNKT